MKKHVKLLNVDFQCLRQYECQSSCCLRYLDVPEHHETTSRPQTMALKKQPNASGSLAAPSRFIDVNSTGLFISSNRYESQTQWSILVPRETFLPLIALETLGFRKGHHAPEQRRRCTRILSNTTFSVACQRHPEIPRPWRRLQQQTPYLASRIFCIFVRTWHDNISLSRRIHLLSRNPHLGHLQAYTLEFCSCGRAPL